MTPWPSDCFSWALLGSYRAVSAPHMDAGGLATWVQILKGSKIWYIATEYPLPTKNGWSEDYDAWKWQSMVLEEGDIM